MNVIYQRNLSLSISVIIISTMSMMTIAKFLAEKPECNEKRVNQVDHSSIALNMFGSNRRYPVKREDVKKFCE